MRAAEGAPLHLRYGGDRAFPPFEILDGSGRPQGLQIDLLQALARIGGIEWSVRLDDWRSIQSAFAAGEVDVIAFVETPERAQTALVTRAYAAVPFVAFVRADDAAPVALLDLADRRLAVRDSDPARHTADILRQAQAAAVLVEATAQEALQAVRDGRADVALLARPHALAVRVPEGLRKADLELPLQPYVLAVAPGREALRERLDAALATLEADGTLGELRSRWLDVEAGRAMADRDAAQQQRQLAWVGAGTAALMASAAWIVARRRSLALAGERQRRAAAEQELEAVRERLALAFDRHPDPMLLADLAGGVVADANDAWCALVDQPRERLLGTALEDVSGFDDREEFLRTLQLAAAQGRVEGAALKVRRGDAARTVLLACEPLQIANQAHVLVVLRDVTDLVRVETELREGLTQLEASLADGRRHLDAARGALSRAERDRQAYEGRVALGLRDTSRVLYGLAERLRAELEAGRLDAVRTHADNLVAASRRMDRMVAGLAHLAHVGRAPLRRERVDMTFIVRGVVRRLESARAPAPAVAWLVDDLPAAEADLQLIATLWQELLDNA